MPLLPQVYLFPSGNRVIIFARTCPKKCIIDKPVVPLSRRLNENQTCAAMRSYVINHILFLLLLAVSVTSCRVVGGIFKAGMWVGIIGVVLVVALVFWIFRKTT